MLQALKVKPKLKWRFQELEIPGPWAIQHAEERARKGASLGKTPCAARGAAEEPVLRVPSAAQLTISPSNRQGIIRFSFCSARFLFCSGLIVPCYA